MRRLKTSIKQLKYVLTAIMLYGVMGMPVYAAEPQFVTGTRELVNDITKYLLGFVAIVTTLLFIITLYQWNMAAEEEKLRYKKKAIWTVMIGVGIIVGGSVITWVFGYYQ